MADVFRCDYCSTLAPIRDAIIYWAQGDLLDDDQQTWLPAVYCSPYCGRTATASSGSGRG